MKKFIKVIVWIIVILLIISCALFACIPLILSSEGGKNSLLRSLEKKYGGTYIVEELAFSWFGFQKAAGIKIEQANETITAEEISLDLSLFQFFGMRNYPLEMVFSGELLVTGGKIYLPNNTSLSNVDFVTNKEHRSMKMSGNTKTASGRTGKFLIEGKESDTWDWRGTTTYFPSQVIELLYPDFPTAPIIGESFHAKFLYANQDLQLSFDSPALNLITEGRLTNKRFMLTKKTTINYVLDQTASDAIFHSSSVKPVSSQTIVATIDPQNARFSYHPFEAKSIMIDSMNLDLGNMVFRNFGTFSDLLSIVELRYRPNQDVRIWFQDMPISVHQGVATISRSEMLIENKYQLGLWSDVDFVKENVNGGIALTAQVLKKVFGLKSIPPSYNIVLPFDGPFSDINLHKSKALRQIARVVLAEKTGIPIIPFPTIKAPFERPTAPWKK